MLKKATSSRAAAPGVSAAAELLDTIRTLLPEQTFPAIYQAMQGPDGERLSAEMHRLLSSRLLTRPPRRPVKRMGRLISGQYDEVVMLKDVSVSGVRLLLPGSESLDLNQTLNMDLEVRLPNGRHTIPLTLVRLCGRQGNHLDIGCRFTATGTQQEALVTQIRDHFFGG